MWVEFVVGSRPYSEGFSPGSLVFLPPQKSTLLNSNLIWKQWMKSHFVEIPLQIPIIIIIIITFGRQNHLPYYISHSILLVFNDNVKMFQIC